MIPTLLAAGVATIVRSLAVRRLGRWNIPTSLIMVVVGCVAGFFVDAAADAAFNTEVAERVAEIILAILLFVDATEVRGGRLLGPAPGVATRLLLVAMPISLAAATALALVFFPDLPWPVLLVLACIVVPIDFAPSEEIVRDRRLSTRLRSALNVEGGYNDGIASPIFVFALLLATGGSRSSPGAALGAALGQAAVAIGVGVVLGAALAWLLDCATQIGWTTVQARRITVLLVPVVTYGTSASLHGNGFVAAFVSGIAFRYVYRLLPARRLRRVGSATPARAPGPAPATPPPTTTTTTTTTDFVLLEDITVLLTSAMWFVVGIAGILLIRYADVSLVTYSALALTVIRLLPALLALVGTRLSWNERVLAGLLGPRGTTSIVFGLLAYNGLPDGQPADTILLTTVLVVVGSVLLHGSGARAIIGRLAGDEHPREEAHGGDSPDYVGEHRRSAEEGEYRSVGTAGTEPSAQGPSGSSRTNETRPLR